MKITEEYILRALRNQSTRIERDGSHRCVLREGIVTIARNNRVVDICAVPAALVESMINRGLLEDDGKRITAAREVRKKQAQRNRNKWRTQITCRRLLDESPI